MKFEPISYDHAAKLINTRPWEVSRDPELLGAALQRALDEYQVDTCVVGLDIYNVEIEAYGCTIVDSGDNGVPAAGTPILDEIDQILSLQFNPAVDGRMPMLLRAARTLADDNPDVDIRIPLSGPFTIACHLLGMENMICSLFAEPESAVSALTHLAENQLIYARAAQDLGFSISLFESSVSPPLLSPQLFTGRVLPSIAKIIDGVHCDVQLIIGGNTVHIVDALRSSGAAYLICPVETDQKAFMDRVAEDPEILVRVNMNPGVFLPGKRDAALREAERVLQLAEVRKSTSIGSLLPYDADSAIVHEVARLAGGGQ